MIALLIGLGVIVASLALAVWLGLAFELPPAVVGYYDTLFAYAYDGLGILDFFCPLEYIRPIFTIWLILHGAWFTYCVIRWVYGFIN